MIRSSTWRPIGVMVRILASFPSISRQATVVNAVGVVTNNTLRQAGEILRCERRRLDQQLVYALRVLDRGEVLRVTKPKPSLFQRFDDRRLVGDAQPIAPPAATPCGMCLS